MLEVTIALTWYLHKFLDAYIVGGLLLFNAGLSLFEERRADAAVSSLKQRLQSFARVKRDGRWSTISARELVPGDTVRLRAGDIAPADVKVVQGEVEVDQSALTGESLTVKKKNGEVVYAGSTTKRGEATGVVSATGVRTYFGRTVELVQLARPKLHMEEVTARVVRWLVTMVVALLAFALTISYARHENLVELVPLATVLLVSAIPVALPSMFSISMALGSVELSKRGVLVTRLSASEDAATMDVLCTDKTGTLTKNRLRVTLTTPSQGFDTHDVLLFGALSSNEANQDPIDLAFISSAREAGIDLGGFSQLEFVPFDPSARMTRALVKSQDGNFRVAKGAVSAILELCELRTAGEELEKQVREFTARGYRVLAVAKEKEQRFLLVGLAALSDELREDSPALIRELAHLGVNVKMLTGDAKPVAEEVAQKLSLTGEVGEMSRLKSATAQEFADMVERTQVFAEIYPEDKYNIVKALQEKKHIVGMTGDGVNDAAALKQAEVGIAVMDATDVAKGAASAVLTVPGLEPIVEMVKTGRMVYQRIVTWIVNKLVKTFQIVVFAVLAYLVTREFVVSVFSMVLYLFLTDFLTLSLSTDRVGYSKKPDTWNVSWLVTLGLLLGALVVVESFGVLYAGFVLFRLGSEMNRLHMYVFTYLVLSGALNVLILRERRRFWRSKPSTPLLLSLIADTVLVLAISLVGVYELAPITAYEAAFTLASACIFAFTINDALKAFIIKKRGVS